MTVSDVFRELIRRPGIHLIQHWNWKAATMSAAVRGPIFFAANLPAGLPAAMHALSLDVPLRLATVGFYAAIVQAFRRADPAWAASLTAVLLLVSLTHVSELIVHGLGGTARLRASMLASLAFSALSTLFNLYIMRRDVLIVGEPAARPLLEDLRHLPSLVFGFMVELPRLFARGVRLVVRG
jgi:hypothetical protein